MSKNKELATQVEAYRSRHSELKTREIVTKDDRMEVLRNEMSSKFAHEGQKSPTVADNATQKVSNRFKNKSLFAASYAASIKILAVNKFRNHKRCQLSTY